MLPARLLLACVPALLLFGPAHSAEPEHCRSGAYRFDDGSQLLIQPSDDANLRYRWLDGRSGKLFPVAQGHYESGAGWSSRDPVILKATFGECGDGTVRFEPTESTPRNGHKIPLPTTAITFNNGDATLYGELVLPEQHPPKALVVLQYGGGRDSAVADNYVQYLLPLSDVAVFVYDKRGTGRSTGQFNAHIGMQSDDLVAALAAARKDPRVAGLPVGLMGESQGGWVVPLAATKAQVDFVVVSYGLVVSMLEEDRLEVEQQLRTRGHGPDAVTKGLAMHDIAGRVLVSRFTDGLEDLAQAQRTYGNEPWFRDLGGDLTSTLLLTPPESLPQLKAAFDFPYDLRYDPLPATRSLAVPQLWLLAGSDTEAPHESTLTLLQGLQREGRPIDVILFPQADHGIIAVDPATHKPTDRTAPGYFERLSAWIVRQARLATGERKGAASTGK